MVRANDIQEALLHVIGWKQSYDTSEFKISEALTASESGLYFQQIHPLLTLENLMSISPDFKNTVYPEYDTTKQYHKGNVVSLTGALYKALVDSIGEEPAPGSEYWAETNPFSEWLEDKTKASIQKAIMRFNNEKLVGKTAKSLCEHKTLFNGTGRLSDTVRNQSNLVGLEIVPIRAGGITTKINKIGLQFTKAGTYKLYLFHSSSAEAIRVIECTKTKDNCTEWFSFDDLFLPYQSAATDAGGSWYLCYNQNELPEDSLAIRRERDWSKGPCTSCSRVEYADWLAWSKYLEIHPFYVNRELVPESEGAIGMWDLEYNQYTYDNNFGLNLEVTVDCDLTDFIIEQRMLFQDVIGKQVAVDMLREFAYNANARTNRHSINASRLDILYEIDGDSSSMKKSGLSNQLDIAFKAIKLNMSGVDRVCLPCHNGGIKYRTV